MPRKKTEPTFNEGEVEPKGHRRINTATGAFVRTVEVSAKRGAWQDRRRSELLSVAKGAPQVVIKIWSGGKTFRSVKESLAYISRLGELPLENEDGETILGKDQLYALGLEWRDGGTPIPDESMLTEYQCFVFCAPKAVDPALVESAASEVISELFQGFQYVKALHKKETDPSPRASDYPHLHLIVKSRSLMGDRLFLGARRAMYLRERYAQALRDRGVEMAATRKFEQFKDRRPDENREVEQTGTRGLADDSYALQTYSDLWEKLQNGTTLERLQATIVSDYIETHTGIDLEKSRQPGGSGRER